MKQPKNMTLKGTVDSRRASKTQLPLSELFAQPARWSVLLAMVLSPWAFGSVHYWAQQWMALALLVGIGFWWFETAMNHRNRQTLPYLGILVILGILLGFFQLLPLPGWISEWVLGRQPEIYQKFSGLDNPSVRGTLFVEGTWNQLKMLTLGLAGLMLGCRYFRTSQHLVLLLVVATANAGLLSFIGIVQKLTYQGQILWTFDVFAGLPFATFVNRNNGAGFILMGLACCVGLLPIVMSIRKTTGPAPIISKEMPFWRQFNYYLLYFISELSATKIAVLLGTVMIAAGVVGSTSRGGGLSMLVGSVVTLLAYGLARRPKNISLVLIPLVMLITLLTGWIGLSDQLIKRFEATDLTNVDNLDGRIETWRDTWPAVSEMGWFGTGLGTYRQAHRLYNTNREDQLFVHAENQFFQGLVEAGWPGLILFGLAWVLAFRYAWLLLFQGQSMSTIGAGTFGVFLLSSQATASMFDFGLYIPANLLQLSVLVGALAYQAQSLGGRLKKKSWLRFDTPNFLVQPLLLLLFAGLTLAGLSFYRYAQLDTVMRRPLELNYQTLDAAATKTKLEELEPLVSRCPSTAALNYLAELWIHKGRLGYFEDLLQEEKNKNFLLLRPAADERKKALDIIWSETLLERMHEQLRYHRRSGELLSAASFVRRPYFRDNLPMAARYLLYSRSQAPLQPVVQLRLGQLAGVLDSQSSDLLPGGPDFERSIQLAPQNSNYRLLAAIYYLQTEDFKSAAPHLKKFLELRANDGDFNKVMQLLTGQTVHRIDEMPLKFVAEEIVPKDANLLYKFAKDWSARDPEAQQYALKTADELLGETMPAQTPLILLRADIRLEQGRKDLAIEAMLAALRGNPMDLNTQYRVADLLLEEGRYREALIEAKKLWSFNRQNDVYNSLIARIETELDRQAQKRNE